MGHTYTSILIHALFSTNGRRPLLDEIVRGVPYDPRYVSR